MKTATEKTVIWQITGSLYPDPQQGEIIHIYELPEAAYEMIAARNLPYKQLLNLVSQHGVLQDGKTARGDTIAAVRKIDYVLDEMRLAFHQAGAHQDPDWQRPAVLRYDLKNGCLTSALHFDHDRCKGVAGPKEIEILQATLPLPVVPPRWLPGLTIDS